MQWWQGDLRGIPVGPGIVRADSVLSLDMHCFTYLVQQFHRGRIVVNSSIYRQRY